MPDYYLDIERGTVAYKVESRSSTQADELRIQLYFFENEPVANIKRSKLVKRQETTLGGIGTRMNKDWVLYNPWGPEDWAAGEPWMIFRETGENPSELQKQYEDAIWLIQPTYVGFNRGPSRHYLMKKGQYIEPIQTYGEYSVGNRLCSKTAWPKDGIARAFFPNGKFVISHGLFEENGKVADIKDYTLCPERRFEPQTQGGEH